MFRAIVCYSHSRSARTQSKQKKPSRAYTMGSGIPAVSKFPSTHLAKQPSSDISWCSVYVLPSTVTSIFQPSEVISMSILFFRPYVLLYGSGIDFYHNDNDNDTPVSVILNRAPTRCVVNEAPTLIFDQVSDNQLPLSNRLPLNLMSFIPAFVFTGYPRYRR